MIAKLQWRKTPTHDSITLIQWDNVEWVDCVPGLVTIWTFDGDYQEIPIPNKQFSVEIGDSPITPQMREDYQLATWERITQQIVKGEE